MQVILVVATFEMWLSTIPKAVDSVKHVELQMDCFS
jgi:hypothetical protein